MTKREITLVDMSKYSVRATLWGSTAENFSTSEKSVIALKNVKVNDFAGRSLSSLSTSQLFVNPDHPTAHQIRGWYDEEGQTATFEPIGGAVGGGGGRVDDKQRKTVAQITAEQVGDKTEYFSLDATIIFIRPENCYYPACPTEGCGKKVVEEGQGMWRCEKCDRSHPAPDYRYILTINVADHTGSIWVQCYNDTAQVVMSCTAQHLAELKDEDPTAYAAVLKQASFQQLSFKLRAKQETFQVIVIVNY